jgi:hypothetical protein
VVQLHSGAGKKKKKKKKLKACMHGIPSERDE